MKKTFFRNVDDISSSPGVIVRDQDILCQYKDLCTDFMQKCRSCANNRGCRSYYIPWNMPNPDLLPIFPQWRLRPAEIR